MSEWLTTGAMIDRLQIDDIAKSFHEENTKYVRRLVSGIYWCGEDGNVINSLLLTGGTLKLKWRILPKYVTFEEAKKAYEEGKKIKCTYPHYKNENNAGTEVYSKNIPEIAGAISWHLITKGKWQIIE